MKKWLIFLMVTLLLVLVSCTNDVSEVTDILVENESQNQTSDLENVSEICVPGWKCIEDEKAYLNEDCSWSDRLTCPLGCEEGECIKGEVCEVGFKCKDENVKGYRLESCSWTTITECEWGCENAKCNLEPEPEEIVKIVEVSSAIKNLEIGDINVATIGETEYNITIYDLNQNYVILHINDADSEEILEGGNFTYQDLTVFVEAIYFQPYENGAREIQYSLE
ncbi:hypothetical protein HOI26_00415 [Candidatus Woesearchaeota archaeon]|jgi:hypothetical protein|nr:hypothetical protein [Candidatus Woesearchaeota archaeon]MBT5739536.1 hypothetical protein [Candidatus Woesearchaeota archaeon]